MSSALPVTSRLVPANLSIVLSKATAISEALLVSRPSLVSMTAVAGCRALIAQPVELAAFALVPFVRLSILAPPRATMPSALATSVSGAKAFA